MQIFGTALCTKILISIICHEISSRPKHIFVAPESLPLIQKKGLAQIEMPFHFRGHLKTSVSEEAGIEI